MSNKLTRMAKQLLNIEEDLPCRFDYARDRHAHIDNFDVYVFEQTWGSTALGFGGIGGQAMTAENTYVFIPLNCDQPCFVYFGSRFAYKVEYSDIFMNDVRSGHVESVSRSGKYTSANNTN